jgi:hypothetical protein
MDDMRETDFGDFDSSGAEHPRYPDAHLQSPIRPILRQCLFEPLEKVPKFLRSTLTSLPVLRTKLNIKSEHIYGILLQSGTNPPEDMPITPWIEKHYTDSMNSVLELMEQTHAGCGFPKIPGYYNLRTDDKARLSELQRWIDVRVNMQEIKARQDEPDTPSWTILETTPLPVEEMYLSGYYCILKLKTTETPTPQEDWYILDYDQVMMICDTLSGRTFSLWFNHMLADDMPGKVPEDIMMFMYETLDSIFITQGNDTYRSLSMFEPMMLALLLDKHDSLRKASDFLGWVKTAMQDASFAAMNLLLQKLEDSDISAEALCELHGLFRHWGHPTVHEELGCEKTRIIGQTRSYPSVSSQRRMVGLLKRQFYISFLNKHGRPPRVKNLSDFKGKPLYDLLRTGSKTLNLYSPAYTLEDWGFIRYDKEFEFDYHVDYTELMDDKALSPLRSEMRTAFNPDRLGYPPGRASTSRRVLEEVLNRETINVRRICELVQLRLIPNDWLIIMIHAKERELKEAPRMFAMMVFEMRAYFCVTESNIAKIIFAYYPQQTMTLDEAELAKRLLFLSDIIKDPTKFLGIFNIIDFSSWNLAHTRLLTEPFFEMLDDLFGTPGLFANTHWFFEQCVIVMASYLNPPSTLLTSQSGDPPACNELWYGHAGGFEGLRQKGWTLITIALLLYVEQIIGMKSYIIGQGDNQICKVMIPIPDSFDDVESYLQFGGDDLDAKIKLFLDTLTAAAREIGLTVKPDETCVSRDIVIYGKDILKRGSFMPQALKRISRTLADVNEIYPTMETKIATVQTSGSASSQKSLNYITPYVVSTTESTSLIFVS